MAEVTPIPDDRPLDRRHLLRLGGLAAATAAVVAACGGDDEAAAPAEGEEEQTEEEVSESDARFLERASGLEAAAIAAYEDLVAVESVASDQAAADALRTFVEHHEEHLRVLVGATEGLGGDANRDPDSAFSAQLAPLVSAATTPEQALEAAYAIERALTDAYVEAAPDIEGARTRKLVLATAGAEARHAANAASLHEGGVLEPYPPDGLWPTTGSRPVTPPPSTTSTSSTSSTTSTSTTTSTTGTGTDTTSTTTSTTAP